jgi:hypothetical protein
MHNGDYFYTEAEWVKSNLGLSTEKAGLAHAYDFKTHQLVSKKIDSTEMTSAKKLKYDFDPRNSKDCATLSPQPLK